MPGTTEPADRSADDPAQIRLTKRFFKATEWAAARHAARPRRGPATPSLGQVLGVASVVLEDGGTEREAIAAMVLDAVGDGELPVDEVRARFGKKVARLVARCAVERADSASTAARLANEDDEAVRRVLAADALRELREIVAALRRAGSITFARFAAQPAEQLARYDAARAGAHTSRPDGSAEPGAPGAQPRDASIVRARHRRRSVARRVPRHRRRRRLGQRSLGTLNHT